MNTAQHFVPQFYLREWADQNGRVWQYPVTGGSALHTRVRNVAFQRGLYSHPAEDRKPPLETEQDLAKLEGLYAGVWPGIIDRAADVETRQNFSRFLALMAIRNPRHERDVASLNASIRDLATNLASDEIVEFIGRDGRTAACSVEEILTGTRDEKDAIKSGFLRSLRHLVGPISERVMQRRWGVVFSDRPAFLTTDCPVVLDRWNCCRDSFGFGTPGTQILFPVCPTRLLVIDDEWPHDFAHYKLTDANVFNRIVAAHAARFVYGSNDVSDLPARIRSWRTNPTARTPVPKIRIVEDRTSC